MVCFSESNSIGFLLHADHDTQASITQSDSSHSMDVGITQNQYKMPKPEKMLTFVILLVQTIRCATGINKDSLTVR